VSLWILDTDHFSLFQRGHPLVRQRINAVNFEEIAITIITAEEQLRGRLSPIRRAASANEMVLAYTRLWESLEDFKTINLLNFDRDAYACYAELVRQRIRIGTQDLRIAAIAISRNATLVTRNRQDFERVPGLVFEDWSIA
jgi:tRNA(fMet)-specific endonuclease VapC